jgi:hypothetical protein
MQFALLSDRKSKGYAIAPPPVLRAIGAATTMARCAASPLRNIGGLCASTWCKTGMESQTYG